jgi:hypothetical protein
VNASQALAIALAVSAAAVGVWRGTWAVGGSDSSCYGLMAQAFASGSAQPSSALALAAPWPNAALTLAPGGFIPSPVRLDAASPVCAPGFSLLLAPFHFLGGPDAIFLVTPLAGAWLVYLTFVLGRRLAGNAVGLASAVVVAFTPVFVFQVVQPMNDVAVAAIWLAIVVLATDREPRVAPMGALTGLAVLIRPNLAPAAIVMAVWCLVFGWRRVVVFSAAAAPFVVCLLWLNAVLYGHALESGYGTVAELFSPAHVTANVHNYGRALFETGLGWPLLGVAAWLSAPRERRRQVVLGLALVAAVIAVYLVYRPLPEWWYLRFLLPAMPIMTVLAFAFVAWATRRPLVTIPVALGLALYMANTSAMREALDLSRLERRFRTAATVAAERLPPTAVFLSVWESGSVRYHAGRDAVVWDSLEPAALPEAIRWLDEHGRDVYIMIEDWEEPHFRERFGGQAAVGQLDWPPRFEIERRVKIYRPGDRDAFFRGENIPTEVVRPDRR